MLRLLIPAAMLLTGCATGASDPAPLLVEYDPARRARAATEIDAMQREGCTDADGRYYVCELPRFIDDYAKLRAVLSSGGVSGR